MNEDLFVDTLYLVARLNPKDQLMMIQLEVQTDTAAILAAQAQQQGVSLDAYLRRLVSGQKTAPASGLTLSPQEKAALWRKWAASHNHDTPLLPDEAISRESIYGERG